MKICSTCKIEKALDEFRTRKMNRHCKTGISSQCKECERTFNREYHRKHKELIAKRKTETNALLYMKKRSSILAKVAEYQKENPFTVIAAVAKRRSAKLKATPMWADLEAISRFYAECPDGMTVDHIVPLRGKTVCGLHVENNLQYLTSPENSRKGARWDSWEDSKRFDADLK